MPASEPSARRPCDAGPPPRTLLGWHGQVSRRRHHPTGVRPITRKRTNPVRFAMRRRRLGTDGTVADESEGRARRVRHCVGLSVGPSLRERLRCGGLAASHLADRLTPRLGAPAEDPRRAEEHSRLRKAHAAWPCQVSATPQARETASETLGREGSTAAPRPAQAHRPGTFGPAHPRAWSRLTFSRGCVPTGCGGREPPRRDSARRSRR
jgi:hypothetical protein